MTNMHPATVVIVATVATAIEMGISTEICLSSLHGSAVYYVDIVSLLIILLLYAIGMIWYSIYRIRKQKWK